MKVLIAVLGWRGGAANGEHQTLRETSLQDVASYPVDYKFFVGDDTPTGEDETALNRTLLECHHPSLNYDGTSGTLQVPRPPYNPNYPEDLEAIMPRFTPKDDEVLLPVPDDYAHLTYKAREVLRWAIQRGYDFIFMCCPDTCINLERLMASGFQRHDYTARSIGYGKGGNGKWMSRKAAALVINEPVTDWAEDR